MTRVLTDMGPEEAMRLWCKVNPGCAAHPSGSGAYPPSLYVLDYARAVEAAVLTKITRRADHLTWPSPYVNADGSLQGYVTEREARKRERAAAMACYFAGGIGRSADAITPWIDHAYPIPTVSRPRTVTLSDGTVMRKNIAGDGWDRMVHGVRMIRLLELCDLFAYARTPADARLLADLVEHPFEEVPE